MIVVNHIIDCLEKTPAILQNLLDQIPADLYGERRHKNKWSIHEQVCHLVEAQDILLYRFRQFESEKNPLIKSYIPPADRDSGYFMKMNFEDELDKFPRIRKEMIKILKAYDASYWDLKGRHEVFSPYSTVLLLTHSLNVDYAHVFSIEQLGLTKPGFEDEILTLP